MEQSTQVEGKILCTLVVCKTFALFTYKVI